jgi:hypothetical protein
VQSAVVLALLAGACPAAAQVRLSLQWLYPLETIFISDFTPQSSGSHPDLLGITLINSGGIESVVLGIAVSLEGSSSSLVFSGSTSPFLLREPTRRITNRDFATAGRDVSLTTYTVSRELDAIADRIGHTGRLPAGTYVFSVTLTTANGVPLDNAEVRIRIGNPTRLELLSPGRPSSEPPPTLTSPSPRFLWSIDAAGGPEQGGVNRLRVARADGAASAQEAITGFAAWEAVIEGTSALYPGAGTAARLEPGGTYAWQVVREVRTSGGVERIESPIYWFRMGGPGEGTATSGGEEGVSQRMVALLLRLGLGPQLDGFRPANPVTIDGRTVSLESLEELLAAIASGEIPLLSIRIR